MSEELYLGEERYHANQGSQEILESQLRSPSHSPHFDSLDWCSTVGASSDPSFVGFTWHSVIFCCFRGVRNPCATFHDSVFRTPLRIAGKTGDHVEGMSKDCSDGVVTPSSQFRKSASIPDIKLCFTHLAASTHLSSTFEKGSSLSLNTNPNYCFTGTVAQEDHGRDRQLRKGIEQHVSRRCSCWRSLGQMDPVIFLYEGHRSDVLFNLNGLTLEEHVMSQPLVGNRRNFDRLPKLASSNIRESMSKRPRDV